MTSAGRTPRLLARSNSIRWQSQPQVHSSRSIASSSGSGPAAVQQQPRRGFVTQSPEDPVDGSALAESMVRHRRAALEQLRATHGFEAYPAQFERPDAGGIPGFVAKFAGIEAGARLPENRVVLTGNFRPPCCVLTLCFWLLFSPRVSGAAGSPYLN